MESPVDQWFVQALTRRMSLLQPLSSPPQPQPQSTMLFQNESSFAPLFPFSGSSISPSSAIPKAASRRVRIEGVRRPRPARPSTSPEGGGRAAAEEEAAAARSASKQGMAEKYKDEVSVLLRRLSELESRVEGGGNIVYTAPKPIRPERSTLPNKKDRNNEKRRRDYAYRIKLIEWCKGEINALLHQHNGQHHPPPPP